MLTTITLSADVDLLDKALAKAEQENTTLNTLFNYWLRDYVSGPSIGEPYDMLMSGMSAVNVVRKYNRDEMNERR